MKIATMTDRHQHTSPRSPAEIWIDVPRRNPRAECRLFCVPYAGGTGLVYRPWLKALPDFIEVLPLQLPGRGSRIKEPLMNNLLEIAERMVNELAPLFLEKPFALFGHSLGAAICFEIARKLRAGYGVSPFLLMASGRQAPHLIEREEATYQLEDNEFLERVKRLNGMPREVVESQELMELLMPMLRADFQAVETYKYRPGPPLGCPIVAFGGRQDPEVSQEDIEAWGQYTTSNFGFQMYDGGHFFLREQEAELLRDIKRELVRCWQFFSGGPHPARL